MPRFKYLLACFALAILVPSCASAQSIAVYQTTPDLLETLS
jgi:hypothetical protein